MDIHIRIRFEMEVKVDVSKFVFSVFLYPIPDPYSTISGSIRIRKENKVAWTYLKVFSS